MTVVSSCNAITFAGDGVQTQFDFNFRIFKEQDLCAVLRNSAGEERKLVLGSDFKLLSGLGSDDGGRILYPVSGDPVPVGESITIYREVAYTQDLELVDNDPFSAQLLNEAFDRGVMRDQQLQAQVDRALKYDISTPAEEQLTPQEFVKTLSDNRSASIQAYAGAVEARNESRSAQAAAEDARLGAEVARKGAFDALAAAETARDSTREIALGELATMRSAPPVLSGPYAAPEGTTIYIKITDHIEDGLTSYDVDTLGCGTASVTGGTISWTLGNVEIDTPKAVKVFRRKNGELYSDSTTHWVRVSRVVAQNGPTVVFADTSEGWDKAPDADGFQPPAHSVSVANTSQILSAQPEITRTSGGLTVLPDSTPSVLNFAEFVAVGDVLCTDQGEATVKIVTHTPAAGEVAEFYTATLLAALPEVPVKVFKNPLWDAVALSGSQTESFISSKTLLVAGDSLLTNKGTGEVASVAEEMETVYTVSDATAFATTVEETRISNEEDSRIPNGTTVAKLGAWLEKDKDCVGKLYIVRFNADGSVTPVVSVAYSETGRGTRHFFDLEKPYSIPNDGLVYQPALCSLSGSWGYTGGTAWLVGQEMFTGATYQPSASSAVGVCAAVAAVYTAALKEPLSGVPFVVSKRNKTAIAVGAGAANEYLGPRRELALSVKTEKVELLPGMITNPGSALGFFDPSALVDGNLTYSMSSSGFNCETTPVGAILHFDLGRARELVKFRCYGRVRAIWDIEYSDDNVSWEIAYSRYVSPIAAAGSWTEAEWASVGAHRYWRWRKVNNPEEAQYIGEIEAYVLTSRESTIGKLVLESTGSIKDKLAVLKPSAELAPDPLFTHDGTDGGWSFGATTDPALISGGKADFNAVAMWDSFFVLGIAGAEGKKYLIKVVVESITTGALAAYAWGSQEDGTAVENIHEISTSGTHWFTIETDDNSTKIGLQQRTGICDAVVSEFRIQEFDQTVSPACQHRTIEVDGKPAEISSVAERPLLPCTKAGNDAVPAMTDWRMDGYTVNASEYNEGHGGWRVFNDNPDDYWFATNGTVMERSWVELVFPAPKSIYGLRITRSEERVSDAPRSFTVWAANPDNYYTRLLHIPDDKVLGGEKSAIWFFDRVGNFTHYKVVFVANQQGVPTSVAAAGVELFETPHEATVKFTEPLTQVPASAAIPDRCILRPADYSFGIDSSGGLTITGDRISLPNDPYLKGLAMAVSGHEDMRFKSGKIYIQEKM